VSLGIAIKGTEGIVLAADSRVTLEARKPGMPPLPITFDNATKILSFSGNHRYVGAVTYGAAVIGTRTAHGFVSEFEQGRLSGRERLSIKEYADLLSEFFSNQWKLSMPNDYRGPDMTFMVGGYSPNSAYGELFLFGVPGQPHPIPQQEAGFGMMWGGQLEIVSRLVHGFDPQLIGIVQAALNLDTNQTQRLAIELTSKLQYPIPWDVLALQDCVDMATFLIRSTMTAQRMAVALRGVGGAVDVATITRTTELSYVQQKKIHGDSQ
jgi:hypothetical protein